MRSCEVPAEDAPDASDGPPQQLPVEVAFRQVLDVERLRLERDNRRSGVAEKAIELADTQDRRHFEYANKTLDANMSIQEARMAFLRRLAWVSSGFFALLVCGLLGFAFYGNEVQRILAERIVVSGLIGLAGYGVITTVTKVVKALAKP